MHESLFLFLRLESKLVNFSTNKLVHVMCPLKLLVEAHYFYCSNQQSLLFYLTLSFTDIPHNWWRTRCAQFAIVDAAILGLAVFIITLMHAVILKKNAMGSAAALADPASRFH
uniref:Uncharacterized protein n=1 Tax=Trieres chinensis TaxID=1514140 RepID=A0A7S2EHA5_TRICV|mmetsp:Transcript_22779/g.46234  ORF Transcript_22779/g.46234 Transcript_22779/m.46234 type:complete len:113 (+) Transcript_22779:429-767(+)|eukprot:CAMPEP_0183306064 /NCGR_PEP_ID=MMETSP0160_2-20130417/10608_1 /TAXON_ID=2839 ORGANISM="Odontella Sinensis, Strain Grunow 1884" /NCGR_SAMPLE_ID=MMETSP0160_2 /ASSEMBLY_ACC=CAM_ASM_000250 /LENGTH=112 /DNA_ID=CAMNT_0025469375 /DNA_START=255 /DNA_END=593 /DNA_ORIENTATION=+